MRRVMPLEYSFSCRLRARSRPTILIRLSIRSLEHVVRDVEQPAVEVERLFGVQEAVEIRLFRQVADALVLADVGGVFAEDEGLALGGKQQAEQQLDRGGFAGAVGAEQAEDLALLDFQVERLEGPHLWPAPEIAIDLREGPRFDDCLIRHTNSLFDRWTTAHRYTHAERRRRATVSAGGYEAHAIAGSPNGGPEHRPLARLGRPLRLAER